MQRFNGDAKAIGATIKVDSRIFTIVGVVAPGLRFPARVDVFVPSWIVARPFDARGSQLPGDRPVE